jgi:hypothetical protein
VGVVSAATYYEWTLAELLAADDDDDHLTHTACRHDEDRALCGANLAGVPWMPATTGPHPDDCIVCETMNADGTCSCPASVIVAWWRREVRG